MRRLKDKAAAYAQVSVSEFVLSHAIEKEQSMVRMHETMSLSQKDFSAFLEALDKPTQPNAALQRAYQPSYQARWADFRIGSIFNTKFSN